MTLKEFENLSEQEQWNWVVRNSDSVKLIELDNDETYIRLKEWDEETGEYSRFKDWLGNGPGVGLLLNALGIENSGV
jgi:hypothetical protein